LGTFDSQETRRKTWPFLDMEVDPKLRYAFVAEWLDIHAQLYRQYELFFYPSDNSIEMYDPKQKKTFLKRTKQDIALNSIFIGAAINVNSRQLLIRDYSDEFTRKQLDKKKQSTCFTITSNFGKVLDHLYKNGFVVSRCRYYLKNVICEAVKENIEQEFQTVIEKFGSSIKTGSVQEFFQEPSRTARLRNCTLCIIKPHAIIQGLAGEIIQEIERNGFQITDLQLLHLDSKNAEEFLEVYKGVVADYHLMLSQLTSGPCLAM
jgi:nucleoside-diphosphate kinase